MKTPEHTSKIFLSKSALQKNFKYLRNLVGEERIISHVVKGNAYGHGLKTFVPLALECGAKHFSTFDAHEAEIVCDQTPADVDVLIMGMIDNTRLEWAIEEEVGFFVFELDRLKAATKAAKKVGKKARVHIEFETGMNRTGFEKKVHSELKSWLKDNSDHLSLEGYCTHYAGAENFANFLRVEDQYRKFTQLAKEFEDYGLKAKMHHTACSAASVRLPNTRMDMVRIGIMQYGFWPSTETYIHTVQPKNRAYDDPLQRVISWKSKVMSIKNVEQGEYIGYGTSFMAERDMKIAIVPIGYGHGFGRSLSNTGRVLIRGKRLTVVGTVNMNATMVDVSSLDNIEKGDEVVLIGEQGEHTISVSSFGEYSEQLNYELLTRLPAEIPRTVVK